MSLEAREIKLFGGISRDFAGISRKYPKSLRQKKFVLNLWPLTPDTDFGCQTNSFCKLVAPTVPPSWWPCVAHYCETISAKIRGSKRGWREGVGDKQGLKIHQGSSSELFRGFQRVFFARGQISIIGFFACTGCTT